MELPLGGPALRHYTQSRPRPHRQKLNYRPCRPQETIIESENEVLEHMGRVDEGVEEFFTKRVLPTDILNKPDEELTVVQEEVAPASSIPCPAPTKTLKRKLGDFFTLKKRRGLKSETSQEGRTKKTSIADLIRPLREVTRSEKDKDKDRVKEQAKENEKEKAKEHPGAVTGEPVVQETPVTDDASLRSEVVPPRRALREGKSQSLILLSGSAATGTANAKNTAKKQFEGQHSFEQKLHLMLQRIGVSKPQPAETQNQEGEMKKAESEGTIIDSKPEPPPTLSKPRTMSASSDTRHQIRTSVSAHEAAGKPALPPKPVVKPGLPPATSGRNTPENELTQIQEAESNTSATLSPASAPPALTDATAPSPPTISNSVSDSACVTVSPSSTVTPADTDVCTRSETPTSSTPLESKISVHKTGDSSTEPPTSPKSTTITTEPPSTISVPSTSSESTTPSLPVTSTTPVTSLSATTPETVSAPSDQSSVSTTSTNLLTESTLQKPNGALSVDSTPAVESGISVLTAASSSCTAISDVPSSLSAITGSGTAAGDDPSSFGSSSHVSLLSSIPEVTQSLPNSSESSTVAVSGEIPVATSSTVVPPVPPSPSSSHPAPNEAISSASSSEVNSLSTAVTVTSTAISITSTSSNETKPKDATSTTTTATCSNETENTFTCSSVTAAVSFSCTNGLDISNSVSTTLSPPVSGLLPADNSSATSDDLVGSAPPDDSPGQDENVKTSEEERPDVEEAEKLTEKGDTDEEMIQMNKLDEVYGSEETPDNDKEDENVKDKLVFDNDDMTGTEKQGESVKAEDDTLIIAGKESEQSRDEAVAEAQIQEEATSESSK
ncbi:mucin-5AC [Oryzias melastigma]|uniref:mucin-5AC n=1 Tax=Oryzias melastigma TaxID=30732 RepID=UPI000CF82E9E|nr:mucin-5AC [Oryzias melastigma]